MKRRAWWKWIVGIVSCLAVLLYVLVWLQIPVPGLAFLNPVRPDGIAFGGEFADPTQAISQTVPIQRAADFLVDLTLSGKLEFGNVQEIKAPYEEAIAAVNVAAGDSVRTGDSMATLERAKLGLQLDEAWVELSKAREDLTTLMQEGSGVDLLEAKAALLTAQEELAKLQRGPAATDRSSAQLAVAEAQAAYDQLVKRNDPNASKVRDARFALKQAENSVQRAQTAYDAIAWKGDIAASAEAAALQSATIAFESTQAAYDEATQPPSENELKKAQLDISKAQNEYAKLVQPATPAQLEEANAKQAKAQEKLDQLAKGPAPLKVQEAENKALAALTKFEELRTRLLTASNLPTPIDGLVIKVAVKPGQVVKAGEVVATVAEPQKFKLTLAVSELYILKVSEGMAAQIKLDVLPDELLTGTVKRVAPLESSSNSADSNQNSFGGGPQLTTFPVTVEVTDSPLLTKLRAGLSAQVTFVGTNDLAPDSWLVPQSAITPLNETTGMVQRLRDGQPEVLEVTLTKQTLGEWLVVISPDLQADDQLLGSTTSFLDQSVPNGFR